MLTELSQPPHSLESEHAVIGGLFMQPAKIIDVQLILVEQDFYQLILRDIFQAQVICYEENQNFDVFTVLDQLKKKQLDDRVGGLSFLASLNSNTASAAHVTTYAKIVRDKSQLRELIVTLNQAQESAYSPDADLIDIIQVLSKGIDHALTSQSDTTKTMHEVVQASRERLRENIESGRNNTTAGISTGLKLLDERLGGFQKQRVYLLAARPSVGKTALSNQLSLYAATNSHKVAIISLEMGIEDLGFRLQANYYDVNGSALVFGNETEAKKLSKAEDEYIFSGKTDLSELPIVIDVDTYSLTSIIAKLTQIQRKYGLDMVVIDHIGLIEHKSSSRYESVGEVSRAMKKLSKRLNVAMLVLVQLNRENVKNKRKPQESDLRDSGNLEQDADVIIFLHAEDDTKGQRQRPIEIGLSKVRYGVPGWVIGAGGTTPFRFIGETQKITELGVYENY